MRFDQVISILNLLIVYCHLADRFGTVGLISIVLPCWCVSLIEKHKTMFLPWDFILNVAVRHSGNIFALLWYLPFFCNVLFCILSYTAEKITHKRRRETLTKSMHCSVTALSKCIVKRRGECAFLISPMSLAYITYWWFSYRSKYILLLNSNISQLPLRQNFLHKSLMCPNWSVLIWISLASFSL